MSESLSHAAEDVNELLKTKEFGAPLKKAREKLNLSATDVAESLLIAVDVIKAIDNSQAQALPALTFTQGYIRNYARLVNVPAEDILNDYMKMAPDSKQSFSPHSVIPIQKNSNDALLKFISISFVATLVLVLIYWLYSTDFKVSDTQAPKIESALIGAQEKKHEVPQRIQYKNFNSVDVGVTPDVISEERLSEKVDAPVVTAEQPEIVVVEKTFASLVLSALGKSWCEVQDATGKRLYYQLINKGDEITLSGVAPFVVFLGNAPKVRVEIDNKIVDFENLINTNSNIANLEINQDASVTRLSNR